MVLRVCSRSGEPAKHPIPSGLSLEQELVCAGRDEQPDIQHPLPLDTYKGVNSPEFVSAASVPGQV